MTQKTFIKGLSKETRQPIIILEGEEEVDRFTGVWRYMKAKQRKQIAMEFEMIPAKQKEAIEDAVAAMAEDMKAFSSLSEEDQAKYLKQHKFKSPRDLEFNEDHAQKIMADHDKMYFDIVKKQLIRCEMPEGDEREWTDKTLAEVWDYPEYSSAFIHRLKQLTHGQYVKEADAKN